MKLIDLLRERLIRTWYNRNFLVHMQFTNKSYIADTIEEAIQVANMTKGQQETLSAYPSCVSKCRCGFYKVPISTF